MTQRQILQHSNVQNYTITHSELRYAHVRRARTVCVRRQGAEGHFFIEAPDSSGSAFKRLQGFWGRAGRRFVSDVCVRTSDVRAADVNQLCSTSWATAVRRRMFRAESCRKVALTPATHD